MTSSAYRLNIFFASLWSQTPRIGTPSRPLSVKQKAWQLHRHYIDTLSSLRDEDQRLFASITTNITVHPLHTLLPPITRNYSIPIRHIVINFHAKQLHVHLHFMTIISFIVFYILTFCRMSTHLHCIYTFLFFFTV